MPTSTTTLLTQSSPLTNGSSVATTAAAISTATAAAAATVDDLLVQTTSAMSLAQVVTSSGVVGGIGSSIGGGSGGGVANATATTATELLASALQHVVSSPSSSMSLIHPPSSSLSTLPTPTQITNQIMPTPEDDLAVVQLLNGAMTSAAAAAAIINNNNNNPTTANNNLLVDGGGCNDLSDELNLKHADLSAAITLNSSLLNGTTPTSMLLANTSCSPSSSSTLTSGGFGVEPNPWSTTNDEPHLGMNGMPNTFQTRFSPNPYFNGGNGGHGGGSGGSGNNSNNSSNNSIVQAMQRRAITASHSAGSGGYPPQPPHGLSPNNVGRSPTLMQQGQQPGGGMGGPMGGSHQQQNQPQQSYKSPYPTWSNAPPPNNGPWSQMGGNSGNSSQPPWHRGRSTPNMNPMAMGSRKPNPHLSPFGGPNSVSSMGQHSNVSISPSKYRRSTSFPGKTMSGFPTGNLPDCGGLDGVDPFLFNQVS